MPGGHAQHCPDRAQEDDGAVSCEDPEPGPGRSSCWQTPRTGRAALLVQTGAESASTKPQGTEHDAMCPSHLCQAGVTHGNRGRATWGQPREGAAPAAPRRELSEEEDAAVPQTSSARPFTAPPWDSWKRLRGSFRVSSCSFPAV